MSGHLLSTTDGLEYSTEVIKPVHSIAWQNATIPILNVGDMLFEPFYRYQRQLEVWEERPWWQRVLRPKPQLRGFPFE